MDIVIDGNDYYISGWTDNKRNATHYYPTVWKNNQSSRKTLKEATLRRSEVSSNDREAYASAITLKNGVLYASGYTYFDFSVTSASYWTIDFSGNNKIYLFFVAYFLLNLAFSPLLTSFALRKLSV